MNLILSVFMVVAVSACAGKSQKTEPSIENSSTQLVVTGAINKDAIRKVVQDNQKSVKTCYSNELKKLANLDGKVVFEWVIIEGGKVADAKVLSSTLNNTDVEQCVLKELTTWTFPAPPSGQEAVVSYPIGFHSR